MAKRGDTGPPKSTPAPERAKRPAATASATSSLRKALKAGTKVNGPPPIDEPVSEDLQAIFGENLKAARREGGLTQSDVAERLGFAQSRIALIESGHQNLTLKTMTRLAEVVGHNVSDMLLKPNFHRKKP